MDNKDIPAMPKISMISADGTGDYTAMISWFAAEGNSNYDASQLADLPLTCAKSPLAELDKASK